MDKAELLEFIRAERERALNRESQHGITQWAVIGGLLFLVYEFLRLATSAVRTEFDWSDACRYYSQSQFALMACYVVISLHGRPDGSRAFENRIHVSVRDNGLFAIFTRIGLLFALPAISSHVALMSESSGWMTGAQLRINAWTGWAYGFSFLLSVFIDRFAYRKTRLPPPAFPRLPQGKLVDVTQAVLSCLMLEVFVANTAQLTLAAIRDPTEAALLIAPSFSMALFILGLISLWTLRTSHARTETFDSLERDILFHGLSVEEAKQRLEAEYLGHELGEWLSSKVASVRAKARALIEQAKAADQLVDQPQSVGSERNAKLQAFVNAFASSFATYDTDVNRLLDWLNIARNLNRVPADPFYHHALRSSTQGIKETHAELTGIWQQLSAKVLAALPE